MHQILARLSARRRGPKASFVMLLVALVLTGGAFAVLAPAEADTDQAGPSVVAQGQQLFQVGCASCHGKNAEGVVQEGGDAQYGPSLVGVGAAAVDFQVGTGRMPLARPGVQANRKEVLYSEDEITALAAYVQSLGPGPAIPQRSDYDPATIPEGQREEAVARGGQFFQTNCTACHNFAAVGGALPGGKFAPSLKGVDDKYVYEAMLTGPQQMPVFSDRVLKPEEKRDLIAYLRSIEEAPSYGGSTLGSLGPVSEGLFAWIVGIGLLVGFAIWIASSSVRSRKGHES